nr:glycosyltransferase family 2 protein [Anaerolineae bacterium]
MSGLAVVILTHNEAANIADCLESLRLADGAPLAGRVVVFDSFSTDNTAELAVRSGAQVIQHPFENYAAQRNAALEAVDTDWVFFVDADERVTPELAAEILEKLPLSLRGWWVPRHNYIFGRLTKGAGWYPDYQMRLLHRESARYDRDRPVHEIVILDGPDGHLENPLIHYNYHDMEQFRQKQATYAGFEAQRRFQQGERVKFWTYLTMPLRHFWLRFVTWRGYSDGLHGLRLSVLMSLYELQMWRMVRRLQRG